MKNELLKNKISKSISDKTISDNLIYLSMALLKHNTLSSAGKSNYSPNMVYLLSAAVDNGIDKDSIGKKVNSITIENYTNCISLKQALKISYICNDGDYIYDKNYLPDAVCGFVSNEEYASILKDFGYTDMGSETLDNSWSGHESGQDYDTDNANENANNSDTFNSSDGKFEEGDPVEKAQAANSCNSVASPTLPSTGASLPSGSKTEQGSANTQTPPKIQVFPNDEFGQIRAILINGDPWFVGKDVAAALGYENTRDAIYKHVDSEDKNTVAIHDGIQGNPNMTIINESGLYSLIFGSRMEGAKRFKHWVTSEVLPAIRKT